MPFLNIWLEGLKAIFDGIGFMGSWGVTIGVIVIIMRLLTIFSPQIIDTINELKAECNNPNHTTIKLLPKKEKGILNFSNWFYDLIYKNALSESSRGRSKSIKEFCSLEHNMENKKIVYFTNSTFTKEDLKFLFTIISKAGIKAGIVLYTQSEVHPQEIHEAIEEVKLEFPKMGVIPIESIQFVNIIIKELTSVNSIISFLRISDDCIFKQLKLRKDRDNIFGPFALENV